jgi:hypothetical protein
MRIGKLVASRKLILMLFLCLAAAAVPTTLLLDELTAQAHRAVQAAAGAKSVKAVLECIALVQRHRALSNEVLSGNAALAGQRSAVKANLCTHCGEATFSRETTERIRRLADDSGRSADLAASFELG